MKISIYGLHLRHGGVERAVVSAANLLSEAGHQVSLKITYNLGEPAYRLNPEVRLCYLSDRRPNREAFLEALRQKRLIKAFGEGCRALKTLYIKKKCLKDALKAEDSEAVITTRHEDNLLLSAADLPGVLKIAQLHHDLLPEDPRFKALKKAYGGLDVVTCLTEKQRAETAAALAEANGKAKPRVVFLPNVLDPSNLCTADELREISRRRRERLSGKSAAEAEFRLITVARLEKEKGVGRLLEVFSKVRKDLHHATFRIVGDGSERAALEEKAQALGVAAETQFSGMLDPAELYKALADSDVFLMGSYTEGFGLVLLEAAAKALPLIAFDVRTGPGSIIEHGQNGFLIPDGDLEAFASAVKTLASDLALYEKMSLNVLDLTEKYSEAAVGRIWRSILNLNQGQT